MPARHPVQPVLGILLQWLLLAWLPGLRRVGARAPAEPDEPRVCMELEDENGRWDGSRAVGDVYSLRCAPGFQVTGSLGKSSATISCPENLEWPTVLECEDMDSCGSLKYGCGPKGICIDLVNTYDCNCEKGYERRRSDNGEIVCSDDETEDICGRNTCSAYGLCIVLATVSGGANQTPVAGGPAYRCECTEGFSYNGSTCVRYDCGELHDDFGAWSGSTLFDQEYTLKCPEGTFVWSSKGLRDTTIRCTRKGKWPSHPFCYSPALDAQNAELTSLRLWISLGCVLACICCAALAAGLTLGLATLEPFSLTVIISTRPQHCRSTEAEERLYRDQSDAKLMLPLVRDHHRLLVTLMLFNTIANEALPIFLDELVPSWVAVLVSVTAVLICGEILPSAVFTGPSRMRIAGAFVPLVKLLQWFFHYLSMPIVAMLDNLIEPEDPEGCIKYSRAELRALLQLHGSFAGGDDEACHGPRAGSGDCACDPGGGGALGDCLMAEQTPEEGPLAHERHDGECGESAAVLARSELRLIDGSFNLQDMPLDKIPYAKRRHCTVGQVEEVATELVAQNALALGRRAVLVLSGGPGAQGLVPQQSAATSPRSCPLVSADLVRGCLRPRNLLSGGHKTLGSLCTEPLVLIPNDLTAFGALKLLDDAGSGLGVVTRGGWDESTVQGVVSRAEILSSMLRKPKPTGDAGSGEPVSPPTSLDAFTSSVVPSASKRHIGLRPLLMRTNSSFEASGPGTNGRPRAHSSSVQRYISHNST